MEERKLPNKGGLFKQQKKVVRVRLQQLQMNWLKNEHSAAFSTLWYYCFFFGFPRSSHSLVGALLDAHPGALIAHEQDAFRYIYHGFSREQLYALLIRNAKRKARKGRMQTSYHYHLPGQYPGTWDTLRVIGDKKGANTCRWLQAYPWLLAHLRQTINEPIKAINVIRNPFDNIATIAKRKVKWDVSKVNETVMRKAVEEYTFLSQKTLMLESELAKHERLNLYSEELVRQPRENLKALLTFLNLEPYEEYLADCEAMIFKKPTKPRWDVSWPHDLITHLEELISSNFLLQGYDFKT